MGRKKTRERFGEMYLGGLGEEVEDSRQMYGGEVVLKFIEDADTTQIRGRFKLVVPGRQRCHGSQVGRVENVALYKSDAFGRHVVCICAEKLVAEAPELYQDVVSVALAHRSRNVPAIMSVAMISLADQPSKMALRVSVPTATLGFELRYRRCMLH